MPGRKRQKNSGLLGGVLDGLVVRFADFSDPQHSRAKWCTCPELPKHRGHYKMFSTPKTAAERKRLWEEDGLLP